MFGNRRKKRQATEDGATETTVELIAPALSPRSPFDEPPIGVSAVIADNADNAGNESIDVSAVEPAFVHAAHDLPVPEIVIDLDRFLAGLIEICERLDAKMAASCSVPPWDYSATGATMLGERDTIRPLAA